jgi:hypothetical protein
MYGIFLYALTQIVLALELEFNIEIAHRGTNDFDGVALAEIKKWLVKLGEALLWVTSSIHISPA